MVNERKPAGFVRNGEGDKWEYEFPQGKLVRIVVQGNSSFMGNLSERSNSKEVYLQPHIISEFLIMPDGKEIPNFRTENEFPTIIERGGVIAIQPLSEDYVKRLPKIIFNSYKSFEDGSGI